MKSTSLLIVGFMVLVAWACWFNPKQFIKLVARLGNSAQAVTASSPTVFVPPDPLPQQANWTWTVDGKRYDHVVITKVEADIVSVTFDDGMGRIEIARLSPELQKLLHYDPRLANEAASERNAAQDQSRLALAATSEADNAAAAPSAPTPPASETAPVKHVDNSARMQQLQARIAELNQDIAFMQREKAKLTNGQYYAPGGSVVSHGGYDDKIQSEQSEVDADKDEICQLNLAQK